MKKDDYDFGFYGKGLDGYVHYKQAFDEINKSSPSRPTKKRNPQPPSTSDDLWDSFSVVFGGIVTIGGGLALLIWLISVFSSCM